MNYTERAVSGRIGLLAAGIKGLGCLRQRWSCAIGAFVLAVLVEGMGRTLYAGETAAAGQWNIMVVPARMTAYSAEARLRFEKNCASCHSKDGRAQTPVAKQRHVRDLSESTLTDDQIIEQILQGTHNKVVDFKMPPFDEKLARAEIESLVPVIKAFRPVLPDVSITNAPNPRLAGIINFPNRKAAVLEKVAHSGRYFILNLDESHDGIQLLKLKPSNGTARLAVAGMTAPITLRLNPQLAEAARATTPGFLRRLFTSAGDQHHSLALDQANTDLVLFLYAQLKGRTLLRSARLPATSFSLQVAADDQAHLALALARALAENGIASVLDGDKFLRIVPAAEISAAKPRVSEIGSLASGKGGPVLFPGGAFINLPGTELSQVIKLYPDLTGCPLDQTQPLPANCTVKFTTQTALSGEECAYALETLAELQGAKIVPMATRSAPGDPISDAGK